MAMHLVVFRHDDGRKRAGIQEREREICAVPSLKSIPVKRYPCEEEAANSGHQEQRIYYLLLLSDARFLPHAKVVVACFELYYKRETLGVVYKIVCYHWTADTIVGILAAIQHGMFAWSCFIAADA